MTTRSIHRSHTRAARWLAAAAIAGLVVGGCGSAENEPTVDSPQGAVTAPDLTSPPSNVRWQDYQGIALPVADQGPDNNSGAGPVSGFAHTPQGAVLAAVQQSVRVSVAPDHQWPAVLGAAAAPGESRDSFAINRQLLSIIAPPVAEERPAITGYTITDYTDNGARVTIFTTFPDDSIAASDTDVIWSGDDWRLLLPDAADTSVRVRSVTDIPSGVITLEKTS
ncbi:hypothetical protein CH267_00210 [Rhodococcus sp. 06-621-2]|nr:hypothetical protein [Rhodococcus sp. 06-621-2]OZC62817.1 hypothetical protein CH267_00210 [Rhodococcus sp. 06-621-2]